MKQLIKDMRSMGYRKMKDGLWGKPVGQALLTIEDNNHSAVFCCWIKGLEKILLWDSIELDMLNILDSIKNAETHNTYFDASIGLVTYFEFINSEELFDL